MRAAAPPRTLHETLLQPDFFWPRDGYYHGKVYSSKDGKEWYSFKRDFVDGYNFDISCFKNENIIVCFNNGELYVSNDLKKVKTIKNPFDGTSPYDYSFFICNNTLIIYNKKEKKFAYWSYSK